MTGAKILGFGGYQPDRVVTNDDLAKLVDTNDEWIRTRVGIQERRFARDDETVADMAEAAGAKALAASGLEPSDIDLVTVATCSPESLMPTVSATVAYRLGIVAPGRLRPQRRLRRVLLRGRRRGRLGAGRQRRATRW